MPIALIIALFLGGGLSYAAEGSLPGSPLYPIKVGINEEVRGWLAVSPEARADWESRRAERRLEEAEKLVVKGEVSADVRAKIEENFERYAKKVEERIAEFESRSDFEAAADVSSNFETSLSAHEKILSNLLQEKKEAHATVKSLLEKVKERGREASQKREKSEAEVNVKVSTEAAVAAEAKMKAAENKIDEVRKFISRIENVLGAEATAKAEARLKVAEGFVAEGKVKLEVKAYGEAFVLFQKAHRIAQEAKLLVEARKDLKIDIKINGNGNGSDDSNKKEEGDRGREEENENSSGRKTDGVEIKSETEIEGDLKIDIGL